MTRDLDDLKAMMTQVTPSPDAARRTENLALARENFEARQGTATPSRPTSVIGQNALWTGVKTMLNTLTSKGALGATTALVACGFLFLTPTGQDLLREPTTITAPSELDNADSLRPELAAAPENAATTEPSFPDADIAAGSLEIPVTAEANRSDNPPQSKTGGQRLSFSPRRDVQGLSDAMPSGASPDGMVAAPAPTIADDFAIMQSSDTEAFANAAANPVNVVSEEPVSTFSIDVDTASYSLVRSSLQNGYMPPPDAVRVEEMINYFPYDYAGPVAGEAPFRPTVTVMGAPWNAGTQLVHIGLQGRMPAMADRPALNLVFLIDTSGSMGQANKLPLLKQSFRLMLDNLRPEDQVAIVEYAGSAGQVLAPTSATNRTTIIQAIQRLGAGGSTNGQGGLEQAYAVAASMAEDGEVSRVILATDGDFNVGINSPDALKTYIAHKRDSGTYLSVLGFGRGNLDDATMQALAQNGNGIAAFIDTLSEAQKVLVDQFTGALFPIAGDVKVQVEFNPASVAEYRLIGYETRSLRREDFNNDAVDAGDLGAGHSVTAIYEVTPVGSAAVLNDPLRYQAAEAGGDAGELGFLKLRYKDPGEDVSQLLEVPILEGTEASTEAQFATAIAGFGQLLRGSDYLGDWGYGQAIELAVANRGADDFGYRTEAVLLMRLAQSLSER